MTNFNPTEEKVLHYLHKRLIAADDFFLEKQICDELKLAPGQVSTILKRFTHLCLIDSHGSSDGTFYSFNNAINNEISELEHRPPINYWTKFLEKWFSKKWTLPFTILFFILPAIAQYIQWIYLLIQWIKGTSVKL